MRAFWHRYGADGLGWAATLAGFAFLYLPMVVVMVYSLSAPKTMTFPIAGWSLRWYEVMAHNRQLLDSVRNSLMVAAIGVTIGLLLGIPAAFAMDRYRFPGRAAFERVAQLPLMLPGIVTGVAMLNAAVLARLKLSLLTVILGHGTFLIAVVMTQVFAGLQRWDRSLEEAAADLGATEVQTFRYVILPNLKFTIVGAALLAFTLSMDEIAVSFFLIGRQNTLPLQIWSMLRLGVTPEVNAISTLILLASVVLIVLWTRLAQEHET